MEPLGTLSNEGGTCDDKPPSCTPLYRSWFSRVGAFIEANTRLCKEREGSSSYIGVYRKSLGVFCFVDFHQK